MNEPRDWPPAVIVHSLSQARLALAQGRPVTLVSAQGAGVYAGAGWWMALIGQAARPAPPHILDCGDAAGRALEALRGGAPCIVLRAEPRVLEEVAAYAARTGARMLTEAPQALDLGRPGAQRKLDGWLNPRPVTRAEASSTSPASSLEPAPTMTLTPKIKEILSWYESDTPGTKASLVRMLNHGQLAGTGKLVILPVDQGFEHGPARSFAANPAAYDPHYHFQLAIDAGLNAYAAPLGMIEAGASTFAGQIPLILKMNSSNSLATEKDQAVTATIGDALRLGCSAIGFTIYPGSEYCFEQMEELRELAEEAKAAGLAVVVWSYPRGPGLDKAGETAFDICGYAAHMAALCGAHIIKVKPPTEVLSLPAAKKVYEEEKIPAGSMAERIRHIVQCCFNGRRLVVFSGGENNKDTGAFVETIRQIAAGGASGAIVGRNSFQRPRAEALQMLSQIVDIYKKA